MTFFEEEESGNEKGEDGEDAGKVKGSERKEWLQKEVLFLKIKREQVSDHSKGLVPFLIKNFVFFFFSFQKLFMITIAELS